MLKIWTARNNTREWSKRKIFAFLKQYLLERRWKCFLLSSSSDVPLDILTQREGNRNREKFFLLLSFPLMIFYIIFRPFITIIHLFSMTKLQFCFLVKNVLGETWLAQVKLSSEMSPSQSPLPSKVVDRGGRIKWVEEEGYMSTKCFIVFLKYIQSFFFLFFFLSNKVAFIQKLKPSFEVKV